MNFLKSILDRIWNNPKTTLAGGVIGGTGAAIFHYIASQAGCDFQLIQWADVAIFAAGQLTGGLATDSGKTAVPMVAS